MAGKPAGELPVLIPLGHEQTTVRRLPWVTFTIIALCTVAFLLTTYGGGNIEERLGGQFEEAFKYYQEHPYLELDPRLKELMFQGVPDSQEDAFIEVLREMKAAAEPTSTILIEQHQIELDRLTEKAFDALYDLPWFRWGLVPAHQTLHGFITYQFMHGGWLHLIGNMLFLFLAGPFVEDRWGRPLFATFYLTAGGVSALLYALRYPAMDGPLIGASASVAGVMGAFLIRYWNTKIKFFYWFFFFFMGTFDAPAWLMLPLWFARELFFAQAMDVVGASSGGGVAHWAHVWGFGFGALVAWGIKHYKVEERYLHKAIEEKITLFDNSALEEGLETYRQGRREEALAMLERTVAEQPDNIDAVLALWNMAAEAQQPELAAQQLMRAVQRAIRVGEIEMVDPHFLELARSTPELGFDPAAALKLAEYLCDQERRIEAEEMMEAAARSVSPATPPGLLLRLARFGGILRWPGTGALVALARAHPEVPEDAKEELAELLDRFPPPLSEDAPASDEAPGDESMEPEPEPPRTLQVMEAVPTALSGPNLSLAVDGQVRNLNLAQLEAVAVAGVAPADERSYIIVDLLLDSPFGARPVLRTVRVKSTHFDPRRVVGGDQPMAAFRSFLRVILDSSEASLLPVAGVVDGTALARFESLAQYEREVLGVEQ